MAKSFILYYNKKNNLNYSTVTKVTHVCHPAKNKKKLDENRNYIKYFV